MGPIGSYFVGYYFYYRYAKDATNITEKIITHTTSKEELAGILFVHQKFKICYSNEKIVTLTLRQSYYVHNIMICEQGGILKIITSQYILSLINPILAKYSKI